MNRAACSQLPTTEPTRTATSTEKREPLTLRIHSGGDGVTFNFHPGSTGGDAVDEVEEVAPPPRRRQNHGPVLQGAAGNPAAHGRAAASFLHRQGASQLGAGPRTIHVLAIRSQGRAGSAAQRPHHLSTDERVSMLKDVRVEMLSPVSVLITWRDPLYSAEHEQGSTQRYYTVRYREQVPTAMWAYRTVSRPHLVLGNLRPRAEYEYAVRVSEGRVDGDWCGPSKQKQQQHQHVASKQARCMNKPQSQTNSPHKTVATTVKPQAVTTVRSTLAPRTKKQPTAKPTPRPISRTQARLNPSQTFQANLTSSSPWELGTLSSTPFTEFDIAGKKRFTAPHVKFINKEPSVPCSITETIERLRGEGESWSGAGHSFNDSLNVTVVAIEGCHSFIVLDWEKPNNDSGNITGGASRDTDAPRDIPAGRVAPAVERAASGWKVRGPLDPLGS
ncbi:unnamed protein product [Lampetra fluviatilis]